MRYDIWRHATSLEMYQEEMRESRRTSDVMQPRRIGKRLWIACKSLPHSPITWIFLMLLGCISALVGALLDAWILVITSYRTSILDSLNQSTIPSFFAWIMWTVVCGLLATLCGIYISSYSDGSGIPQMKAFLAGQLSSKSVLSYPALIARSMGTVLSNASGLSVGKEGPFIHLISIIAHKLSLLGVFRRGPHGVDNITYIRAGIACGVTAVFGSPFGGVLFSIEVTSQFYAIKNLWQSVISSSFCVLTFQIISVLKKDVLFANTKFADFELGPELFAFLALGALCGALSAAFVQSVLYVTKSTSKLLQRYAHPSTRKYRYLQVAGSCLATAVLGFPLLQLFHLTDRTIINESFRDLPLDQTAVASSSNAFFFIILKFFMTLLPCGLPLSCGIFTPLFTLGAVVGRLFGELIHTVVSVSVSPATYAVVGAACLASAATHSISTAVIVFELTGQLSYMLPVMLSVLVAYSVGAMYTPSIYDVLAKFAGLDLVCDDISATVLVNKFAHDVVQPNVGILIPESTYAEATKLLVDFPAQQIFPICDNKTSSTLIGGVSRSDLVIALTRMRNRIHEHDHTDVDNHDGLKGFLTKINHVPDEAALLCGLDQEAAFESTPIIYGPPFNAMSYAALPVDLYPPQVGYMVPLDKVYELSCLYMWTQVFVVKEGKLLGFVVMDASLTST
ncbi:Chloride Channel (ClC) Family [Thraustotheca clavata]|uniref:Chloride Channel (ClC) Family n=1 Tax=Thraustotheca clavata TaxID=74557 RepID=A0A1V9ZQN2_9STRA|nr:Chloride Channel (ClC) Family [Thraustotheca clavata]